MERNFQVVREFARGGAPLDLLFTNREGLVGDMKAGTCLGESDRKVVEFSVFGEVRKKNKKKSFCSPEGASKTATLDFQKADIEGLWLGG